MPRVGAGSDPGRGASATFGAATRLILLRLLFPAATQAEDGAHRAAKEAVVPDNSPPPAPQASNLDLNFRAKMLNAHKDQQKSQRHDQYASFRIA